MSKPVEMIQDWYAPEAGEDEPGNRPGKIYFGGDELTPDEVDQFAAELVRLAIFAREQLKPQELPRGACGCGYDIVYTPKGWQHDAAPYFWGDDHDPDPDGNALAVAELWDAAHPQDETTIDEAAPTHE